MQALTVEPGKPESVRIDDVSEPQAEDGAILVETLAVGACGTDIEILKGRYGWPPPGGSRLVLGHESVGRVLEAPSGTPLAPGDLVVGIARRPDPVPCSSCAVGEWDMCRNGLYIERGIKQRHGYCSERFRIEPEYAIKIPPHMERVGMLVEPASVVAKAWEHIEHIGRRTRWEPTRALITGAGPVGLLATLMATRRGLDAQVLDRVTQGPKPDLVRDIGATYHTGSVADASASADVVIECTGVGQLVLEAMQHTAPGGIICLTGISSGNRELSVDAATMNRNMVLENDVVFGSVNANRRHYEAAVDALSQADPIWLDRLITRRASLKDWSSAFHKEPTNVKSVIEFNC
jgi:threonine dehydrogenase-like Zn-dependent dehydrogenase